MADAATILLDHCLGQKMGLLLKRLIGAGVCFVIVAAIPQLAAAQQNPIAKFFDDFGDGIKSLFGGHTTPSTEKLKPRLSLPADGKPVDPVKFYRVDMKCSITADTANLITEGIGIKQSTFVAHTLWFSSSAGNGAIPTSPSKLVTVFAFEKDKSGVIQDFTNDACSESFLLSGKDGVLTVAFSMTDTKSLSGFSQLIYSGAKMVLGLAPVLFSGPLGASISAAATAAGSTQDPLKEAINAMNGDGRRVAVPTNVLVSDSPTVIRTEYSRIELTVKEVTDVTGQLLTNNKLGESFYSTFDALIAGFFKDASDDPKKLQKCTEFGEKLGRYYKFSKKDKSFFFGYVAQQVFSGGFDNRLDCIGNRYNANDIVDFKFPYNRDSGRFYALTQQVIDNHFIGNGFPREPIASGFARSYSNKLSNLLSKYSQIDDAKAKKAASDALFKLVGNDPINVDDDSTNFYLSPSSVKLQDIFSNLNEHGFKRFGCFFIRPTVGIGGYDAIVLGFPLTVPAGRSNNSFDLGDIVGLRLVIDAAGTEAAVIKRVQLTTDDLAISEPAKEFKGKCPPGLGINLPG
jgi:hypothetical protein